MYITYANLYNGLDIAYVIFHDETECNCYATCIS